MIARVLKVAAGVAAVLVLAAGGLYWAVANGPTPYVPTDLSDLMATPDSPFAVADVSDLEDRVVIERDLSIVVRDGTRLSANVFRPIGPGRVPVIMMFTAYHKDDGLERYPDIMRFNARDTFDVGPLAVSPWTPWEGPDPAYWVAQGYAVVTVDSRGYGLSEGTATVLSLRDRDDFHDAIEWAGTQGWSTGSVGLTGVSYLAISQWVAASGSPPKHLKAIMPWEGQTDPFREVQFHGGIPETSFTPFWARRVKMMANESELPPTAIIDFAATRPMLMRWLIDNVQAPSGIDLESITVPALVGASWSDQGLHTRGTLEGFKRIASEQKWLWVHGRSKWAVYYSDAAKEVQTAFFDHFLKGEANGFEARPRVRVEVRDDLTGHDVRHAEDWPLPGVDHRRLYLDARDGTLGDAPPATAQAARYDARTGEAVFRRTFEDETELTGHMKLRLWVEAEGANDMDLFVAIRKYDAAGDEVTFYGKTGFNQAPAALGWLRVSHRELDPERSTDAQPVLAHARRLALREGDIVPVEIEILPSSTSFAPGETLEISIRGHDQFEHPTLAHENTVNGGTHVIHAGGDYDAYLLAPFVEPLE